MINTLVDAGFSINVCCTVWGVSQQGYYRYQRRPMSATMMRRQWLTALITEVHAESRGTYGSRRVRAELIQGRGIGVSDLLVWRLMHDAGLQGLPGPPGPARTQRCPRVMIWSSAGSLDRGSMSSGLATSQSIPRDKGRFTPAA